MVAENNNNQIDKCIVNCYKGFWWNDEAIKAQSLWEIGNKLGVTFHGMDEDNIKYFIQMEKGTRKRHLTAVGDVKRGVVEFINESVII